MERFHNPEATIRLGYDNFTHYVMNSIPSPTTFDPQLLQQIRTILPPYSTEEGVEDNPTFFNPLLLPK